MGLLPLFSVPSVFSQHLWKLLPARLSLEPVMAGTGHQALLQRGRLRRCPGLLTAASLVAVLWCQRALLAWDWGDSDGTMPFAEHFLWQPFAPDTSSPWTLRTAL